MTDCKYKTEKDLLYTYENDLHSLDRVGRAYATRLCISPALDWKHFLNILNHFKINLNGCSILNLGSGHGVLDSCIAKEYNCHITGVEFSPKRVARSKELAAYAGTTEKITFICEDIHRYLDNLNGKRFNVIMAFEVIEHLVHQREVIRAIKDTLELGGVFFGSVPIQPNCQQIQHISHFESMDQAEDVMGVALYSQDIIPLRLPECCTFYYHNI